MSTFLFVMQIKRNDDDIKQKDSSTDRYVCEYIFCIKIFFINRRFHHLFTAIWRPTHTRRQRNERKNVRFYHCHALRNAQGVTVAQALNM